MAAVKKFPRGLGFAAALGGASAAGSSVSLAWYAAGVVADGLKVTGIPDATLDVGIVDVTSDQIVLDVPELPDRVPDQRAHLGLRWSTGYGHVGPATVIDGRRETRPFALFEGDKPQVGDAMAVLEPFMYPRDPADVGIAFENVAYPGPLGELTGWHVKGSSTWLVMVHGLGATRAEFIRVLDAVRDEGHSALVVTYRNDEGAPRTADSIIRAGQDEFADIAAAVDFAKANGAQRVVLFGASMGGAISLAYTMHAPENVSALVLEAPAASVRDIVSLRSGEALPTGGRFAGALLKLTLRFIGLRTGIDLDAVDYIARAGELGLPILLIHGTADAAVPFLVGERLYRIRPDLVEFHRIEGGGHVRAWNLDREWYSATLRRFLRRVA